MEDKEGNKGRVEPEAGFRFHEQLEVAKKEIEKLFAPAEGPVYRTFINIPPKEKDFTPQALREPDGKALVQGGLTQEEYDKLAPKQKKEYISARTLSVNDSQENAIKAAAAQYAKIEKKWGMERAEEYISEDRGKYVGIIVPKVGQMLISKFDKSGHAEVLLNQDVQKTDLEVRDIIEYKYKDE